MNNLVTGLLTCELQMYAQIDLDVHSSETWNLPSCLLGCLYA